MAVATSCAVGLAEGAWNNGGDGLGSSLGGGETGAHSPPRVVLFNFFLTGLGKCSVPHKTCDVPNAICHVFTDPEDPRRPSWCSTAPAPRAKPLPVYTEAFVRSCGRRPTADRFDFVLVTDAPRAAEEFSGRAPNIRIVEISTAEGFRMSLDLERRFPSLFDYRRRSNESSHATFGGLMHLPLGYFHPCGVRHLYPYLLDHLLEPHHSHWGYFDLDILCGDLPRFVPDEALRAYDVITLGIGDLPRLALAGQISLFHRRKDHGNPCDQRRAHGGRRRGSDLRQYADEGCFSRSVIAPASGNRILWVHAQLHPHSVLMPTQRARLSYDVESGRLWLQTPVLPEQRRLCRNRSAAGEHLTIPLRTIPRHRQGLMGCVGWIPGQSTCAWPEGLPPWERRRTLPEVHHLFFRSTVEQLPAFSSDHHGLLTEATRVLRVECPQLSSDDLWRTEAAYYHNKDAHVVLERGERCGNWMASGECIV